MTNITKKDLARVNKQIKEARNILLKIKETSDDLTSKIFKLERDRSAIENELKKKLEITDNEAPKAGAAWTSQDCSTLENELSLFLYNTAKKLGRSTLAIRYRVFGSIRPYLNI